MYKRMIIGGIIGASMGTVVGYMKKGKMYNKMGKCKDTMIDGIMTMFE